MSTRDLFKILVICGDPGGANAIIPVIKQLALKNKEKILVFAFRQAIDLMQKNNIPFFVLDEKIIDSEIENLLKLKRPDIIVTGTSVKPVGLDIRFIQAARKLKIPSLTILDYWCNYSMRFSDNDGDLKFLPDKIAIMDEIAYGEMISEGFHQDTLIITGQPAFDALSGCKLNFDDNKALIIKHKFQIPADEIFIVFASDPVSIFFGDDKSDPHFLGYTEYTVLNDLIIALEKISKEYNKHIVLLIRPHPKEKLEKYETFASKYIRIIVTNGGNPREIMMASDLVIGMFTELLVEACYLGCIVVSLQPGLLKKDLLPTNKNGYSVSVYSSEKIFDTLKMTLMDCNFRIEMKKKVDLFKHHGDATNRVIKTIYHMMGATYGDIEYND